MCQASVHCGFHAILIKQESCLLPSLSLGTQIALLLSSAHRLHAFGLYPDLQLASASQVWPFFQPRRAFESLDVGLVRSSRRHTF